jgi:branched-chain amino acid aminotransferase
MALSFDQRDGWIWMNGEFVPWKEATTHVLNHGLHYGSSVFEGTRAYNGKIFKLQEHTKRLRFSANELGFDLPYTDGVLNDACQEAMEKNNLTNAYFRPVAWRGSEMMAISAQQATTHVAIACWDWPSYFGKEARENGLKLQLSSWKRPSPESAPVHAKAAGLYMICTLSKHAAEAAGFHDALMLDYRGYVAECTGANIFFITKDKEIHTPTADCFLNGITRRTVMGLAEKHGYKVIERHIMPDEITNFAEVFVTGTAAEVTPIGQIGDHIYGVGPVTLELMDAYTDLVSN